MFYISFKLHNSNFVELYVRPEHLFLCYFAFLFLYCTVVIVQGILFYNLIFRSLENGMLLQKRLEHCCPVCRIYIMYRNRTQESFEVLLPKHYVSCIPTFFRSVSKSKKIVVARFTLQFRWIFKLPKILSRKCSIHICIHVCMYIDFICKFTYFLPNEYNGIPDNISDNTRQAYKGHDQA